MKTRKSKFNSSIDELLASKTLFTVVGYNLISGVILVSISNN